MNSNPSEEKLERLRIYNRNYYKSHKEYFRLKSQRYTKENRKILTLKVKERHKLNPKRARDSDVRRMKKLKESIFNLLGDRCVCCGENERSFLTVDHINHDGAEHRRLVGGGRKIYQDILKQGCPKDKYRIFCMNCNWATRYKTECPHKTKVTELINEIVQKEAQKAPVLVQ